MARFPPADAGNAPGRFQGSQGKAALLLPQAWASTGGEQMYRQGKKYGIKERPKEREEKEQKSAARQTMEVGGKAQGLRKKEKEQDKYRVVAAV